MIDIRFNKFSDWWHCKQQTDDAPINQQCGNIIDNHINDFKGIQNVLRRFLQWLSNHHHHLHQVFHQYHHQDNRLQF